VVRAEAGSDFVLEANAPLQKAHRRHARKQPRKLGNFRHIGLAPEDGFFGVKAQSDIIHCHIKSMARNLVRCRVARKRMKVGDKIKTVMLCLQLQVLTHGTKKVANMKFARWLYAGKNPQSKLPILKIKKLIIKNLHYLIKITAL